MKTLILILIVSVKLTIAQDVTHINSIKDFEKLKNDNMGNVILINFWATWCKPCTDEFPDLVKLYNNYKGKNFKLLFISLDFKEDVDSKLASFLKDNNVNFRTYFLDMQNPEDIMTYLSKDWDGGIPASFLYDQAGIFKKFILGGHSYNYYEGEIKSLM